MMYLLIVLTTLLATTTAKMAPLLGEGNTIDGEYIVIFYKTASEDTIAHHHAFLERQEAAGEISVKHKYNSVLSGYSAKISDRLRDEIRLMPEVKYVHFNQRVKISQGEPCTTSIVQSWGVFRTTVEGKIEPETRFEYLYDIQCSGKGSNVYIVDTGIDINNTREFFEGRAKFGADFVEDGKSGDPNGHGTHVAGTVAANLYGLAPGAEVIAVRVLGGSGAGTFDDVIAGIEWVSKQNTTKKIINMSLGGSFNKAIHDAIEEAFKQGVHTIVAAGGANSDDCNSSPAASEYATTVGATDIADSRAGFSDYGKCVQVFAPGVNITSPYTNGIPRALSGTSMASPHVAGVVAKMLTESNCRGGVPEDPKSVEDHLVATALEGILTDIPSGKNLLLHMPCN